MPSRRGPKPKPPGVRLHVGAARIRDLVRGCKPDDGAALLRLIWPDLSPRLALLVATYPYEVRAAGAHLILPESWQEVAEG